MDSGPSSPASAWTSPCYSARPCGNDPALGGSITLAKGSVSVVADDAKTRQEFLLQKPNQGVFLPAGTWGIQYKYSSDAVLLVFASEHYNADDYIRNYEEFLKFASSAT